jgi:hypothetical protein
MRSLATALGCLVIASYATVGSATMGHDESNDLIASCHLGNNGYVIFRQKVEVEECDDKKISDKKKRRMIQQAPANAGAVLEADEEDLESEGDADVADDGASNERGKKVLQENEHENEDEHEEECDHLEGSVSEEEDE